ncbi:hypothetical protein FRC03_001665 [Tulasnella sp. 419]|nr:hypothetical protein FRC03_001665 [Tulasnella sp. 419]
MDFIEKWIADMEDFIAIMSRTRDSDPQCYRSHFHLLQGFLDAGMVAAFSELPLLVKENSTDIGYRAVKVIKNMVEEIKDDRELGVSVRRMIRTGGFRKLSATLERSTILVRSVAVSCFREIYTRLGMGEDVSADTFGSWLHIFVGQFHQEKYKTFLEQWNEPNSLLKQELDRLYDNIEPANLEIQLRR